MLSAPTNKGNSGRQGYTDPNAGTGTVRHGDATGGGRAGVGATGRAAGADVNNARDQHNDIAKTRLPVISSAGCL